LGYYSQLSLEFEGSKNELPSKWAVCMPSFQETEGRLRSPVAWEWDPCASSHNPEHPNNGEETQCNLELRGSISLPATLIRL